MTDSSDSFLHVAQFLFAGLLLSASLFLLAFLFSSVNHTNAQAKSPTVESGHTVSTSGDPNVVAGGMSVAADNLTRTMNSLNATFSSLAQSAAQNTKFAARATQTGLATTARATGKGVMFVARPIGKGAMFVLRIPGNIVGYVSHTRVVGNVIRPSEHAPVPIIDPNSPELAAALTALPAVPVAPVEGQAAPQNSAGPQWPIHGEITTEFGVAHWPYQPTHTGLDISDGKAPGTTPIYPFRPGKIIDVIHSNAGLGNHVIIDHGNGVTSVYGHMNSISVQIGQDVNLDTVLGFEGTTGVSTGPHVHFEIRVNGQAANPHQFVSGNP